MKFKVGDTVKVVGNIDLICVPDEYFGNVGVVVDRDYGGLPFGSSPYTPYKVKFPDGCTWLLNDETLEYVNADEYVSKSRLIEVLQRIEREGIVALELLRAELDIKVPRKRLRVTLDIKADEYESFLSEDDSQALSEIANAVDSYCTEVAIVSREMMTE